MYEDMGDVLESLCDPEGHLFNYMNVLMDYKVLDNLSLSTPEETHPEFFDRFSHTRVFHRVNKIIRILRKDFMAHYPISGGDSSSVFWYNLAKSGYLSLIDIPSFNTATGRYKDYVLATGIVVWYIDEFKSPYDKEELNDYLDIFLRIFKAEIVRSKNKVK